MSRVEPFCLTTPLTLRRSAELLRIGNLIARREPRAERREGVGALALEALAAAIELEIALGKIDAEHIAEHVIERVAFVRCRRPACR